MEGTFFDAFQLSAKLKGIKKGAFHKNKENRF